MSDSACLQNERVLMAPNFQAFQFFSAGHLELFGVFFFLGLFIYLQKSLGNNRSAMSDSRYLGPQEVSLLAWERRVAID